MQKQDPALKPDHYQFPCSAAAHDILLRFTGFDPDGFQECNELIKAVDADYFTGAAIKYLWRCQKKGFYILDLGKAIESLQQRPRSLSRAQTIHEIRGLINAA